MNYNDLIQKYNLIECNKINRYIKNPILSKNDIPYDAELIFNSGVVYYKNKYLMCFRDDYYFDGSDSTHFHTCIGFAESNDGINFIPFDKPFIKYEDINIGENIRIYDPRLIVLENNLYMCFALDTHHGIRGGIMKINDDLKTYEILSLTAPDNRNLVLFDRKINDYYIRLERPMTMYSRRRKEIFDLWMSYSKDLKYWGDTKLLLKMENIPYANCKIGPAAPPMYTEYGWIVLFHAVIKDELLGKNGYEDKWDKVYTCGVMILDKDKPDNILTISKNPLMIPKEKYETENGFRNNVLFPCALTLNNNIVSIYYGASDTTTCLATIKLEDLIAFAYNK